LKKRNRYIKNPATATAIRACRLISDELCPWVIEVKIGTESSGSRMTKRAENEYISAPGRSAISQQYTHSFGIKGLVPGGIFQEKEYKTISLP